MVAAHEVTVGAPRVHGGDISAVRRLGQPGCAGAPDPSGAPVGQRQPGCLHDAIDDRHRLNPSVTGSAADLFDRFLGWPARVACPPRA